jgi:tetratricopeptide (TPR) repeat protein
MRGFRVWVWNLRNWFFRLHWPRFLTFGYYWNLLTLPFFWALANWRQRRFRDFVFGLPAIVAVCIVFWAVASLRIQEQTLSKRYFDQAELALTSKDLESANLFLEKVLQRRDTQFESAQLLLAAVLNESGEVDRAAALLKDLAPDDRRGNPGAHRRLAMILANETSYESSPEQIRRLLWHLTAAGDDGSPQMSLAWGQYSLAIGDFDSARRQLEFAAQTFPEIWKTLAGIELAAGRVEKAEENYQRAADYLSERMQLNPNDEANRTDYAQVLMKLGRLNEARMVLEQGKLLNPNGNWQWLLASLAVSYHDLQVASGVSVSDALVHLDRALAYDPNHAPALTRLMSYATIKVDDNVKLKDLLARVIAEGKEPALAHLAMGNLCWLEGDQQAAQFHFERASQVRSNVPVILNNLAWLISHDPETPDFDRAMLLVNSALEREPENPSYLDTRGTIFYLKRDWRPALNDLENALKGIRNKRSVHEKLAVVYRELGMQEVSEQHRLLAEQLPKVPTSNTQR